MLNQAMERMHGSLGIRQRVLPTYISPRRGIGRFRKQARPKLDELLLTPEKIAEDESDDMDNDYHSRYPPRLKDGAGCDRPKACVRKQRVVSLGQVQGSRVIQE